MRELSTVDQSCGQGREGVKKSQKFADVIHGWPLNANLQLQSAGSCGAFLGGQNTTDYAVDGYFDDAAVTVWNRGTNAEVIWKVAQSETAGHHKGGFFFSNKLLLSQCLAW